MKYFIQKDGSPFELHVTSDFLPRVGDEIEVLEPPHDLPSLLSVVRVEHMVEPESAVTKQRKSVAIVVVRQLDRDKE